MALELLAAPKSDEPIGELDGLPVFAKNGRYGPYVQWGAADAPPPGLDKPKMSSLFKTMTLERMTVDEADELLSLPRTLGVDPADGEEVVAANGRYGPYVQKGKETRSLITEEQLLEITLDEALAILAQPKAFRGRGGAAAKGPAARVRHRPGEPAAGRGQGRQVRCLRHRRRDQRVAGRGDRLEAMTPERAYELLAVRREQVAEKGPAKKAAKSTKAAEGRRETEEEAGRQEAGRQGVAVGAAGRAWRSGSRAAARPWHTLPLTCERHGPRLLHRLRGERGIAASRPTPGGWPSSSTPC